MRLTGAAYTRPATLEAQVKNRHGPSIAILVALALLVIAWLDRATNELPVHHLCYLPIILAAARFRQTGGLLAAGAAGVLYHHPVSIKFLPSLPIQIATHISPSDWRLIALSV